MEPEVLAFSINFDVVDKSNLMLFFLSLPNTFKLWDLFDTDHQNFDYMLRGFVFYWGMHYYTIFRIWNKNKDKYEWLRIDDTSISKKTWHEIVTSSVDT